MLPAPSSVATHPTAHDVLLTNNKHLAADLPTRPELQAFANGFHALNCSRDNPYSRQ